MQSRYLVSLAAFAVLLLPACAKPAEGGGMAAAGSAADEQAVRDIATKYADAYSKHDTAALGAITADDYEEVDAMGTHTQGRAAAEANAAKDFASMPAGMSMPMTATTVYVRWIDATHAVAGGTWQMTGTMPGMPTRGAWMGVAVKKDSTWKMISTLGAADPMSMMADTTKAKPKGK